MIFNLFKFRDYRLLSKLIMTYFLLTVIPMALLGYLAYKQYTSSIEKQAGEYVPLLLEQAHENIDNQFYEIKKLPNLVYNSSQVIEILRKDSYENKSGLLQDEFYVNSFLTRTYISSGSSPVLGVFILSNDRTFKAVKADFAGLDEHAYPFSPDVEPESKETVILPHQTSLRFEGNQPFIMLKRQLADYDNRGNLGTMFIVIDLTFLSNIFNNLNIENKADIWLMNGEGSIIFHTDASLIGAVDENITVYPLLNGSYRTLQGDNSRLVSKNTSEESGWILSHSILLKDLTEQTDLMRNVTVFLFIIFVILSTSVSVVVAWNVSRPLYRLTRLMKKVEKGNFYVDLPVNSNDEIGLLANSFNSMILEIRNLIQQNYQIQLRQKEAELYALQFQINPHFMYNTLETIGMAVEEGENDTVVKMVTLLGRMLRYSIGNKEKFVPVWMELTHIKDYLTIQEIRFEERLLFSITEEINTAAFFTPKFIIQPIVENAIKYGLDTKERLEISIVIRQHCDLLNGRDEIAFIITDNGPGITEDVLTELNKRFHSNPEVNRDGQFGLMNVHARITMTYGEQYGLKVESTVNSGTSVTVTIPVIRVENVHSVLERIDENDCRKNERCHCR
ncbi:two-component system, sensor histidine kinase YesM [Evansella caseinilytica]|uniref:Two-component system, sensor histidine kinase YesM n=1 Tax=Evansella caseinilytica TaxID=1503961 RepID=A0A1H3H8G1_9BACI|nr:sensor histidine kinase [Evansella caseinilytica]SDY11064.1 two-component system, sensor histidine kinase YesM [Evansella caseinilytica]